MPDDTPVPTAKEIYEAAERTILEIVSGGQSSASFQGRDYTTLDLPKLRETSDYYRELAIQRGEMDAPFSQQKVAVSYPRIWFPDMFNQGL